MEHIIQGTRNQCSPVIVTDVWLRVRDLLFPLEELCLALTLEAHYQVHIAFWSGEQNNQEVATLSSGTKLLQECPLASVPTVLCAVNLS